MEKQWMPLSMTGHQYLWPNPLSIAEIEVKLNTGEVYTAHYFYDVKTGHLGWSYNGVKLPMRKERTDYWRELYNAGQFPEGLI